MRMWPPALFLFYFFFFFFFYFEVLMTVLKEGMQKNYTCFDTWGRFNMTEVLLILLADMKTSSKSGKAYFVHELNLHLKM